MSDDASSETPSAGTRAGERAESDNSLRNFTMGVLAVSAVIIALAYFLQTAAA